MPIRETSGRSVFSKASCFIRRYGYSSLLRHAREDGARKTIAKAAFVPIRWCGWGRAWLVRQIFDRQHGLRTNGHVSLDELAREGLPVEDSHSHLPTPMNVLPDVLSRLDIDYGASTFIDLGSGKGAAILAAAEMKFRRIIGVEFSRDLHATAVENVRKYRQHRAVHGDIELLNMDAREFEFLETDLVIYAFNPFEANLLNEVIERLALSYDVAPRKIFLIYLNATRKINPRSIIAKFGFMTEIRVFRLREMAQFYSKCPFPVVVWVTREGLGDHDAALVPQEQQTTVS